MLCVDGLVMGAVGASRAQGEAPPSHAAYARTPQDHERSGIEPRSGACMVITRSRRMLHIGVMSYGRNGGEPRTGRGFGTGWMRAPSHAACAKKKNSSL